MGFIDSYKSLEKLCSEIFNDNYGVSSYIDEMTNMPIGSQYVPGWNEDLKQLKHYRWVRNQIVHEPGCTEANMCKPGDTEWINRFYSRIMTAKDPLAQYRKAINNSFAVTKRQPYTPNPKSFEATKQRTPAPKFKNVQGKPAGCLSYIVAVLFIAAAAMFIIHSLF